MQIKSVLLITVVLGLAGLAALEIGLRLQPQLLPEGAQLELQWRALDRESPAVAHPYAGFLYPPHFSGQMRHRDFGFSYATDENGFRNPSPWPTRADIVVVGDSQAFGYGVEAEQSWAGLLAERLPDLRIVNLGLNAAAPQQSLRTYELFGAALEPELILFVLFPAHGVNAVGRFDRWVQAGHPATYQTWTSTGGLRALRAAFRDLLRSSHLYMGARHMAGNLLLGHWGRTVEFDDGGRIQLAPILNLDTYRHLDPEHPNFRLVLDTIDRVRQLGVESGAETVVLLIPTKEELHLPRLGIPTPSTTAPFATALETMDVRYIDVSPQLRERVEAGERLFFERDVHPNVEGYQLIADVLSDYLRTNAGRFGFAEAAGRR